MAVLSNSSSPAITALRNFRSQWFLVPQGTGIVAVILHQLKYQFNGLTIISEIFWVFTIFLFVLSLVIYLLRIITFPKEVATALGTEINETACLASISITFTSIIQMMTLCLVHVWGPSWGKAAYVLWWINTAMALAACIGIPYVFVRYEAPGIKGLTPAINLPLIATLTAAAGGGVICRYGELSDELQVPVIIVSYLMIGMALPLALCFSTMFTARLLENASPTGLAVCQEMILCGPWGQASFALQILGACVMRGSFAEYGRGIFLTADAATPVGYASIFAGLLSWGQGTFWWAFAIISIVHASYRKRGEWRELRFGLAAWSLVFPWGVYANACIQLGTLLDSPAFAVWGTALSLMLVVIWIVNMVLTVKGIATGSILELDNGWNRESYQSHQMEKGDNGNSNQGAGDTQRAGSNQSHLD